MLQCTKAAEEVFIGPPPDDSGLRELADERIAAVINLHGDEHDQPLSPGDEGVRAQEMGMEYLCLPIAGGSPTRHQVDDFRKKLQLMAKPVFVHSHHGQLAAAFVIMGLASANHWSAEETLQRAERLGVDGTAAELRDFVRSYADGCREKGRG